MFFLVMTKVMVYTWDTMEFELGAVLIKRTEIVSAVAKMAQQISFDFKSDPPVVMPLLTGAFIFCADLVRMLEFDCQVEFIKAKSYQGSATTGKVEINGLDRLNLKNRRVLLVEDIIDTGLTLSSVKKEIEAKSPKEIKVATLLDKPSRRVTELAPDYCGFTIPDHFVVGYGLDFNEKYRNLPDICQMRMK
jgi:hypoxanthine phosphoribosyltransferase